jgi:sialidase-1
MSSLARGAIAALAFLLPPLTAQNDPEVVIASFDDLESGPLRRARIDGGRLEAADGHAEIHAEHHLSPPHALRLLGGDDRRVELTLDRARDDLDSLSFRAERWTRRDPFAFRVDARVGSAWRTVWTGDTTVRIGRFSTPVRIELGGAGRISALRFVSTAPPESGVLIDDLSLLAAVPQTLKDARQERPTVPILDADQHPVAVCIVEATGSLGAKNVAALQIAAEGPVEILSVRLDGEIPSIPLADPRPDGFRSVGGRLVLGHGTNRIHVEGRRLSAFDADARIDVRIISLRTADGEEIAVAPLADGAPAQRLGTAVRRGGEQGVHTSRIPALVRTAKGTLVAAFDLRHRGGGDLPGDIDVGVRRSTDGGKTFGPTILALDMGAPHDQNGVGDPCLLVDTKTDRVFVFGLWSQGNNGWNGSRAGLDPADTGQLVCAWSDDDGKTWSAPRNLTRALKDPSWRLFLQGPGSGITTSDGTLAIPAQFRDGDGTPHSTVVWSDDRGETWHVGTGARPKTTESSLVELADGSWMLNMRDDRGGSRAVATTRDRGQTWTEHPTSRSALPEPVCMASLIRFERGRPGAADDLLLFSNPAVPRAPRRQITVRYSADDGMTWSEGLLIDEGQSAGYSSLVQIDADTVGILYECSRAHLAFQALPVADILAGSR